MLNRSKLWAAGLLFAAFAAGAAVGGATSAAWGDGDRDVNRNRPGERDSGRHRSYSERLQTALDLTPAQREAIDTIVALRQAETHALWQAVGPRFEALREGVRDQIVAILDEEQQEKYRELIARSHRNREGERGTRNRSNR